jgi:hypothetical protein
MRKKGRLCEVKEEEADDEEEKQKEEEEKRKRIGRMSKVRSNIMVVQHSCLSNKVSRHERE